MTDGNIELTRRKILASAGAVGAAGAATGLGTSAFFSDRETFTNNQLVAGELDMKMGYSAHYSDWSPDEDGGDTDATDDDVDVVMWDGAPDTTGGPGELPTIDGTTYTGLPTNEAWLIAVDDPDQFLDNTQYASDGTASCGIDGTDAGSLEQPVIDIEDVKPGDFGEVTFDFALCDNPGFVWLQGELLSCAENGITEPEAEDDQENEDEERPPESDEASLWPLAALAGVPALGGGDDGEGGADDDAEIAAEAETVEADTTEGEGSDGRSALRKGAAAAGMGAAGLGAASGLASASSKGDGQPTDPDGPNDVNIDNGMLEVNVGELGSGTSVQGTDWIFTRSDGTTIGTLYRETYGFRDGTGPHVEAENEGSLDSAFGSAGPGDTASGDITIPVETQDGTTVTLDVTRNVELDPNEPTLRVSYDVTNPTGSGGTFDDLRLSQYIDYDIGAVGDENGEYFKDTSRGCEFISQASDQSDDPTFSGFTGEEFSVNHDLRPWDSGASEANFQSSDPSFNDEQGRFPDDDDNLGDRTDVTLAMEWSLGSLAPGETTSFETSFVYNEEKADFEEELCEEIDEPAPEPEPTQCADVELLDVVQAAAWVDDGNNYQNGDEAPAIVGSLRDVLATLSSGTGLGLSGDTAAPDGGGAESARNCFSADTRHSVAFAWWVPVDHGNEAQGDSASFELSFYTEQCRHNDGSGQFGNNGDMDDGDDGDDGDDEPDSPSITIDSSGTTQAGGPP